jgi:hypothetical protein
MKNLLAETVFGLCAGLVFMTQNAAAQNDSIDWYKLANGGGTSTGGIYSVSGTIGQPDAGKTFSGGPYSLTGGFWSLMSVAESTGSPPLFVEYSTNSVTVHWPAQNSWVLQENSNLNVPAGWTNSSGLLTANGVSFHTVDNPAGALFFRLKRN